MTRPETSYFTRARAHAALRAADRPQAIRSGLRIALIALPAALLGACNADGKRVRIPIAVRVELAQAAASVDAVSYNGTVRAKTQVDAAFRVDGVIDSVSTSQREGGNPRTLQAGDRVTQGMVLATLRRSDFQQRVSEAEGMTGEVSASYIKGKQDYERAKKLFADGVISRSDFENTKAHMDGLSGESRAAGARASQARLILSETKLRSPLDGIVLERAVEVGSLVAAGTPAFVVADVSTVRALFSVPDKVQGTLALGMTTAVSTDAVPKHVFPSTITKVAAQADPVSRMFEVEATIDNADRLLKVGMVATIRLAQKVAAAQPPVVIPLSAVIRRPTDGDGFTVYVTDEAEGVSAVHARWVDLGALVGNGVTVIKGLTAGERIVVQGSTLVSDGAQVNIVTPAAPPTGLARLAAAPELSR